ncbi:MAG: hypothetical protein ACP5G7_09925 [Anaerolineae bacterium]
MVTIRRLSLAEPSSPELTTAARLFNAELERHGAKPFATDGDGVALRLSLNPALPAEGFALRDGAAGGLDLSGADARGLVYGVGRVLREGRFEGNAWLPGPWRGTDHPSLPVRGIYFATHFFNYYHVAPIEEIQRYVRELALWGINVVAVWFDMHHFAGIDDPAAQAMLERLRAILQAARDVGLDTALTTIANEGYDNSPPELRADWTAGHNGYHHPPGGHYHRELCPSKPGAIEQELRWAEERLEAFAPRACTRTGIDYLWLWPYDQGGCTCPQCAPWGANGFLKMAQPLAHQFKAHNPQGKVLLSTWYFDHFIQGEWEAFDEALPHRPLWADYLMVDDAVDLFPPYPRKHGAPGGLPMVGFPEISMFANWPWGGYGTNPYPARLQRYWDEAGHLLSGGFPYSEGIYEDLNKVLCAGLYWDPGRPVEETLRAYLAYEFGSEHADDLAVAAKALESALPHHLDYRADPPRVHVPDMPQAARAWEIVAGVDAALPPRVREGWRWRVFYARALMDAKLAASGGALTEACYAAAEELAGIYHAGREGIEGSVYPPTREMVARMRGR